MESKDTIYSITLKGSINGLNNMDLLHLSVLICILMVYIEAVALVK